MLLFAGLLFFQKLQLEQQCFGRISGLRGLFVLPALGVVPSKPDLLRFSMPAQPARQFRSLLVFHVICFLQISRYVKNPARSDQATAINACAPTIPNAMLGIQASRRSSCGVCLGVSWVSGVCANEMLPGRCCQLAFWRDSRTVSALESLAAPQGFEPRYADPESAVLPLNEGAANAIVGDRCADSNDQPQ